jgi:hypothetical protein
MKSRFLAEIIGNVFLESKIFSLSLERHHKFTRKCVVKEEKYMWRWGVGK